MDRWLGRLVTLAACLFAAYPVLGDSASVDLVGRKGKVQVIERDGTVRNVDPNDLHINTVRSKSTSPVTPKSAPADDADAQNAQKNGEEANKTPGQENPNEKASTGTTMQEDSKDAKNVKAADTKKKELTPEQIAVRKKDTEAVRKMLDQGGAYFYKDDNTPLSYEEVKKMVESNDVEGIKALDLWQQPWKPASSSDDVKSKLPGENANAAQADTK